jgi:hypothetical protein
MEQFDATLLASTQKSNDLDIHERHAIEIQRNPRLITFYLRPLLSKLTGFQVSSR